MATLKSFQLLEINIISAQDLEVVSRKMKTYATAWVNPTRKLTTRVDNEGHNSPTWNDKFVFRVDEEFLRQDTSAVMIEIYSVHWFRDTLIGTVRILVGNLIQPPARPHHHHHHHMGMRFVALQVRRPSGRPQGILNIGVTLLDSSMRSMPLYRQLSKSAVGYRDLMGEKDPHQHQNNENSNNNNDNNNNNNNNVPVKKPILLRSKSERSITFDKVVGSTNGSLIGVAIKKKNDNRNLPEESSILSISEVGFPYMNKKSKASSVISGAELREKPKQKGLIKGKASSVVSDSIISKDSTAIFNFKINQKPKDKEKKGAVGQEIPLNKVVDEKAVAKTNGAGAGKTIGNGKFVFGGPPAGKANSIIWTDSEVGPSPSEVAAALMVERRYPLEGKGSSMVSGGGWGLDDDSVEGLRSKLERWRTEMPPIYDHQGGFSSGNYRSTGRQVRRNSDGGSGLFSCFGNICGYECQCICGKPRKRSGKFQRSPSSLGSQSYF